MSNQNVKIVYSLRVHIELQRRGFTFLTEMKNPNNPRYNCWVYAATPDLLAAFDDALKGGNRND
jgi:hypothetical protein